MVFTMLITKKQTITLFSFAIVSFIAPSVNAAVRESFLLDPFNWTQIEQLMDTTTTVDMSGQKANLQ
jgi:hypothetical protein